MIFFQTLLDITERPELEILCCAVYSLNVLCNLTVKTRGLQPATDLVYFITMKIVCSSCDTNAKGCLRSNVCHFTVTNEEFVLKHVSCITYES